jgi:hypothetical protein
MGDTIAIQAFNKADTVIATLDSIAKCRDSRKYGLLILQDGCVGSTRTQKDGKAQIDTNQAIEAWITRNRNQFVSVSFNHVERNYGPYVLAERLINEAFEKSGFVIFSEDDVIFERDAIQWFERARRHHGFQREEVWAIAGESKFFEAQRHAPSAADINRALEVAKKHKLTDRFVYFDVLPSSCFATTRDKWAEFGKTRGVACGDRAVVERCRVEGKLCLWPVVARCRDIGMHHPLGWGVRWRGAHHPVFKNSYIVSGMLENGSGDLTQLSPEENRALLNEFTLAWMT